MQRLLPWGAILLVAIVARLLDPVWAPLERAGYDARLALRQDAGWPKDLVFVPIDERALIQHGSWPWPRAKQAVLLDRLREYGVKTIAFDGLPLAATDAENDGVFEKSLDHVLFGAGVAPERTGIDTTDVLRDYVLPVGIAEGAVFRPDELIVPAPRFRKACAGIGHTFVFPKRPDGSVRGHAPFVGIQGLAGGLPSLPLAAYLLQHGIPGERVSATPSALTINGRTLAMTEGEFPLDFVPGGVPPKTVRASAILEGKDPAALHEVFGGSLALVYLDSVYAPDRFRTPMSATMAGGAIHGTAIRTLETLRIPRGIPGTIPFLATVVLVLAGTGALVRRPANRTLASGAVAILLLLGLGIALVHTSDLFLPMVRSSAFLVLSMGAIVGFSAAREARERTQLIALLRPGADAPTIARPIADDVTSGRETVLGRYEILAELGRGGMGAVHLAHDRHLNRRVAIKVLSSTSGNEFARFRREALAAGAINHPNVVTVFEVGLDAQAPYLVLEYLEGGSVSDLLRDPDVESPLPWQRATRIILSIARGLAAAHSRGIVHRDVKPANLLLVSRDGSEAKIADFGIAKLGGAAPLTRDGSFVGTVGYLSPEQASGEEVDARSDVFSLGVTWYRMLTGHAPFDGTAAEVIRATVTGTVPDPRTLAPGIPHAVSELLARMTKRDRAERPADAGKVVVALEALLGLTGTTQPVVR